MIVKRLKKGGKLAFRAAPPSLRPEATLYRAGCSARRSRPRGVFARSGYDRCRETGAVRGPLYLFDELHAAARRQHSSLKYLLLSSLKAQGFGGSDEDLIPDGRRLRRNRIAAP